MELRNQAAIRYSRALADKTAGDCRLSGGKRSPADLNMPADQLLHEGCKLPGPWGNPVPNAAQSPGAQEGGPCFNWPDTTSISHGRLAGVGSDCSRKLGLRWRGKNPHCPHLLGPQLGVIDVIL